jgi:hypothetical protein
MFFQSYYAREEPFDLVPDGCIILQKGMSTKNLSNEPPANLAIGGYNR